MKIINQTKATVLAEDALLADNFWKRMVGLLGKDALRPGQALILKPCNCVHTFFMRFPIDCLFVDKNKIVIKTISCLKPFKITPLYFSSHLVIELPEGAITSSYTREGDTLLFEPQSPKEGRFSK